MFIVDVSPSMARRRIVELPPGPDGVERETTLTNLQWALKYVKWKIQEMIYGGRKTDQCGIILFGTEITNNPVNAENPGGYEHITDFHPICQPTAGLIERLDALESSYDTTGDPLDALIVALSLQDDELGNRKTWTRRAVLITDGENPFEVEDNDLNAIIQKLNDWNVHLAVLGLDFEDEEFPYAGPMKSNVKRANETFYHRFVSKVNRGVIGTYAHALESCSEPDPKAIKSALKAATLSLGDIHQRRSESIEMAVRVAKATSSVSPASLKKFVKRAPLPGSSIEKEETPEIEEHNSDLFAMVPIDLISSIERRTEYVVVDRAAQEKAQKKGLVGNDDGDEAKGGPEAEIIDQVVEKEDLTRAHKYGSTWIPIDDDALGMDKMSTHYGLEILGFIKRNTWHREYSMGEVYYIFAEPKSQYAQVGFSSLVQGMLAKDVLALVRRVASEGGEPRMGVALPRSTEEIDYLVWVRMPFAEDIRRFSFPSLDLVRNRNGKQLKEHPTIPTPAMLDAMDELVETMDLMDCGDKDEDGNPQPWYDPAQSFHPAVHRMKQVIFYAAITSDINKDPLPSPHPELTKYFEPPRKVLKRSKASLETARDIFDVKAVPPKTKVRKRQAGDGLNENAHIPLTLADLMNDDALTPHNFDADGINPSIPQSSALVGGTLKSAVGDSDEMLLDIPDHSSTQRSMIVGEGAKPGRIIGNKHPLYDFRENLSRGDLVPPTVKDMGLVIPEIIEESFSSQRFDEGIECMKAMREVALKEDEVEEWNNFLRSFRTQCKSSTFRHPDFWTLVKERQLGLITSEEDDTSDVSRREAIKFLKD